MKKVLGETLRSGRVLSKKVQDHEFYAELERAAARELSSNETEALRKAAAGHPAWSEALEEELALNRLLGDLPDAPISSNFTARVLQEVRGESARAARMESAPAPAVPWLRWLPRFALTICLFLGGFFSYAQYREGQRTRLAEGVALLGQAAELPDLRALRDFRVIVSLPTKATSDAELLAALQ